MVKHVTIKDLASELHLSVSTVSRALSGDTNIRVETRALVEATAERMGYRRNVAAAQLRKGRTNVVGVIVNEMLTPFASEVMGGIQNVLQPKGVSVMMLNSHDDPVQERENIKLLESHRVDGMVVIPCSSDSNVQMFGRLIAKSYPLVFFSRTLKGLDVSQVVTNDYNRAYYLTEHLVRSGRRRILHLRGPECVQTYENIYKGYLECLDKSGITYDESLVCPTRLWKSDTERMLERLEEEGVDFDAVLACTDVEAIDVMNRLRRRGRRVPEDVAVAAFLGSPLSQMVYPSLTTVEGDLTEMGRKSAEMIQRLIENPELAPLRESVDSRICLRESTHRVLAETE